MATLSIPQLSLDLPSTRMSVNFDNFASSNESSVRPGRLPYTSHLLTRKPLPSHNGKPIRPGYALQPNLTGIEEHREPYPPAPARHDSAHGPSKADKLLHSIHSAYSLSRTDSSASASTSSSKSTVVDSVFSRVPSSTSTRASSPNSFCTPKKSGPYYEPTQLLDLPQSIIEQILSYILPIGYTVTIGPSSDAQRHMFHRYHRPSLDYINLRQILKHPVFVISKQLRSDALDVFYRTCDFSIDLANIYYTKVSSTADENLKRHQRFWNLNTPLAIRESLRRASRLNVRLPVPSTESHGKGRDEDDWMDGSDGKGGGGWIVKSMKKEKEDAAEILKCLETVVRLIMSPSEEDQPPQRLGRSLSLRRKGSTKSRTSSPEMSGEDSKKRSLKKLEVTLVKRNPYTLVLPESLALIRALRSMPVTGYTRYYFELEGQRSLWATKYRSKWRGKEPDGESLLQDLQSLSMAEKQIEPIVTPTEFRFVGVNRSGQLQLSDFAMPKTPITLEKPTRSAKDASDAPLMPSSAVKSILRTPLTIFGRKTHARLDSYTLIMNEGMNGSQPSSKPKSGRAQPPSIDELRMIADGIRNGTY
ncbi:hypothetical protein BU24DRAFT_494754 [Aaosphaeria arxii CBS 175.79]|uniref:F-box domain-containing protein n=1 Tax=Aaosphaeria arxii CBS 175.79 TaxID=1450172 RepID=A0A6A5XHV1_9PLEO|nr:uncharacterized protein BU24DRAFT_494754 [Aaosphaeria arxii CBS 175.79]KAF2012818.1 hypothetical protein BU24DRAFT_494754 [Aaosphaeria arxii CBS 175.79]